MVNLTGKTDLLNVPLMFAKMADVNCLSIDVIVHK
jgi:hypothetical protein